MKKADIKFLKELGNKIKKVRKGQNISQSQLAFESGLHRTQINRIERGKLNTTILVLQSISNALNIPLSKLFEMEK